MIINKRTESSYSEKRKYLSCFDDEKGKGKSEKGLALARPSTHCILGC